MLFGWIKVGQGRMASPALNAGRSLLIPTRTCALQAGHLNMQHTARTAGISDHVIKFLQSMIDPISITAWFFVAKEVIGLLIAGAVLLYCAFMIIFIFFLSK
jgi:hypothetical protein